MYACTSSYYRMMFNNGKADALVDRAETIGSML